MNEQPDRFDLGYQAARRHYTLDRQPIIHVIKAWNDRHQDRGREAITRIWPGLAAAMDELEQAYPDVPVPTKPTPNNHA